MWLFLSCETLAPALVCWIVLEKEKTRRTVKFDKRYRLNFTKGTVEEKQVIALVEIPFRTEQYFSLGTSRKP